MALGLVVQQTLDGTYHWLEEPGVERLARLRIESFLGLRRLIRSGDFELSGWFELEGLVRRTRIMGSSRVHGTGKAIYDFRFVGDDERERRFHGESEVDPLRPKRSLERIFGRLFEDDEEVARVLLRNPLERSVRQLITSARPRWS